MPQQVFDPEEFAPKPKKKPTAYPQKNPVGELLGTMWGTDDSLLPPIRGVTRPALPSSEGTDWQGWDDMKWLYENVVRPSSSVVGSASDYLTGKAIGAVAAPVIRKGVDLYKRFKGATPELPPIRNVEAPVAELPPVKPSEVLDASGRPIAPPQAELPIRPTGPWDQNLASIPIKSELSKPLPPLPVNENESIIDYLRRNGVDSINTTPEEQAANRAAQVVDAPEVPINKPKEPFDPATLGFESNVAKQFDEVEFVNPTTGEIKPASLAEPGDVPVIPEVHQNLTEELDRLGEASLTRDLLPEEKARFRELQGKLFGDTGVDPFDDTIINPMGEEGLPPPVVPINKEPVKPRSRRNIILTDNTSNTPPIRPETLNTDALSRPALDPTQPWIPVGEMPTNQPPLMPIAPQTPFQPAGIPRQLGPKPPRVPPMGPTKPPPPARPLVPNQPPQGPISNALSTWKAWLTSNDISGPGRQGKAFIFNKAWWSSWDDMAKAWSSKAASDAVADSITNHPSKFFSRTTLPNGRQTQSWAEQMGLELPKHEEMFSGSIGKKIDAVTGIERSSRAHTAFLNKLRSDQFVSMIEASQKAGVDPLIRQDLAKMYAKFINEATGRGSLNIGRKVRLERISGELSNAFFAPRNMSGQIRTWNNVLNPVKYYNYDPVLRKQALKSLFAVAGLGTGIGELARLGGAQVSNDPTSSDFRKIKFGDTRIDLFGGYQQFPVAAMKFLTGLSTSTINNKTTDLTAGRFGQRTRKDVGESFFVNRLSPLGSFIWAWMDNREFDGKPFEVKRAMYERVFPIAAKDMWDLAQEDPAIAAAMAIPTMTGLASTQHYTGR